MPLEEEDVKVTVFVEQVPVEEEEATELDDQVSLQEEELMVFVEQVPLEEEEATELDNQVPLEEEEEEEETAELDN